MHLPSHETRKTAEENFSKLPLQTPIFLVGLFCNICNNVWENDSWCSFISAFFFLSIPSKCKSCPGDSCASGPTDHWGGWVGSGAPQYELLQSDRACPFIRLYLLYNIDEGKGKEEGNCFTISPATNSTVLDLKASVCLWTTSVMLKVMYTTNGWQGCWRSQTGWQIMWDTTYFSELLSKESPNSAHPRTERKSWGTGHCSRLHAEQSGQVKVSMCQDHCRAVLPEAQCATFLWPSTWAKQWSRGNLPQSWDQHCGFVN